VKRTADLQRIFTNVRRLKSETNIELHLDLLAGLPGEMYDGFLDSLQVVADLHPHDIQIEPLKLLKGSPMCEIGRREGYCFSEFPPYTILGNPWLSYEDICRIETGGRLLDLFNKHGGFASAFLILQEFRTFSGTFDQMARLAGNMNLSSLSSRRVFELFARLAETLLPGPDRPLLFDALFFDFCNCEMPLLGRLPSFAAEHQKKCSWPAFQDLPDSLKLQPDSRVKSFRYTFMRDYRQEGCKDSPATLTFVYVSGSGRGLKIHIV
jgi:anaerobic magnesium-protoporphyrin IX monomethyl ester cyclase